MRQFLPSKKTLLLLFFLGMVSVVFAIKNKTKPETENIPKTALEIVTAEHLSDKDTDNDKIADWEEGLWGTNPNKEDTDDDGVPDFNEIAARKTSITNGGKITTSEVAPTETDAFARQFFTSITALSQSGNITEKNIQALAELAAGNIAEVTSEKKYRFTDIRTVAVNTSSKTAYKNALKETSEGLALDKLGSEFSLLALSINKPRNEKVGEQLFSISALYETLARRTAVILVPKDITESHLELINAYHGLSVATAGLSKLYVDPIVSTQALARYKEEMDSLVKATTKISAYIRN